VALLDVLKCTSPFSNSGRLKNMASISTEPCADGMENPRSEGFKRILRSRWTFLGLQVLDLLTTLYAFHLGAMEVNPLVAHFTVLFGRVRGVIISKLVAVAIAMGVRKLLWVVNVIYIGVVGWNLITLAGIALLREMRK
jgi:hypothetical protein